MVSFHSSLIVMVEELVINLYAMIVTFELLERDDHVMADRGFQIKEELMLKFCELIVHLEREQRVNLRKKK